MKIVQACISTSNERLNISYLCVVLSQVVQIQNHESTQGDIKFIFFELQMDPVNI
jgi:hypothetical protein